MKIPLNEELIYMDLEPALSKEEILNFLIDLIYKSGKINNKELFKKDIFAREAKITTGIGSGIAIPHTRSKSTDEFVIAFARCKKGCDFASLDNKPVYLFFILSAPLNNDTDYLKFMKILSETLKKAEIREKLKNAKTKKEIIDIIINNNN